MKQRFKGSGSTATHRVQRIRSACWSGLLIPLLFLPYRWLWFPAALAATLLILPNRGTLREVLHRDGTLLVGSAILLLVREGLDPLWWGPWIALMAFVLWWRGRFELRGLRLALMLPVIWFAAFVILARPGGMGHMPRGDIPANAVLVCAGDSLTSGVDIRSDAHTYVAELRQRLPCQVMNAGFANDKTRDLLKRLQKDVLNRHPDVVVVFIGGNDYLDGTPRADFARSLDAIVSRIAATGAHVVLVEVPTGIVWNPYAGVYRRIASRYGAILVPESRLRLWFSIELLARDHLSEPLTIDGIHLSPAGASRVAKWLDPYVRGALEG